MSETKPGAGMSWRERLSLFVHWLVRRDPAIMSECDAIDRYEMFSKAALLGAVAGIALFAWGAFFFLFWPWYIALPLLCPVIAWVVLIDQCIGAANWKLQGVLAAPRQTHRVGRTNAAAILGFVIGNGAVILRFAIAGVTASATSYSATMAISYATIATQEEKDRDAANAALRAAGEAEKQQTWRDMLGADDAAVKEAAAELKTLKDQIAAARQKREDAAGLVTDNQISADCELNGGRGSGCAKGRGPKYRQAAIRSAAADASMRRASADLSVLEARLPEAESQYEDALKTFREREPAWLEAARAIDERVARNVVPARNDPVMAYAALQEIYASPDGAGTRFYSHLILTLLLTVELSYVLVSEYFGHASVYMARLIARTKILAADAAEQYRQKTASLFKRDGGGDERGSFRVVSRFGSKSDREE